ncbi:hypothetical protein ACIBUY_04665 [Streptomyces sp. NPDC050085]|uniref:hypothetical protein n=1 Tax=Streptomyces sp. NPDC050085 TaxID=3365600 RepID=UPI0037972C5E
MTDVTALLDELQRTLPADSVSYTSKSEPWDVYEGYVFTLAVQAAAAAGADVEFRTVKGSPTSDLIFRTSPGNIWSTRREYTHALVSFPGTPELEIHIGVKVEGASRVAHECDVLILWAAEAEYCRRHRSLPRTKFCVVAAECKFYASSPPLGAARGFEGLCVDLGKVGKKAVLVTNGENPSSVRYLTKRRRVWEQNVLPGTEQVKALQEKFRDALRDHIVEFAPECAV